MTLRISTALQNWLLGGGSLKSALENGRIEVYTGSQPATADAAVTGTLLVTITDASGAFTAETPATATLTLDSGASGSINDVTVEGVSILDAAVSYATSLANTATLLAAALNKSSRNLDFVAEASSTTVTLTTKANRGSRMNGLTLASSNTTIATTGSDFASGAYGANGLKFDAAASGTIAKRTGQTWTGVAVANGTAGWFRLYAPFTDAGTLDSSAAKMRLDGSVATSGAQLNMSSTTVTSGATQTVTSFSPTMPSA